MDNSYNELEELLLNYHNDKTKISVGNRTTLIKNKKRPKSLVLGVRSLKFVNARKDKSLNPHLTMHTQTDIGFKIYKLSYEIIKKSFPDFNFNQIIINYNTNFLIHKDSRNKDLDSVIFSVGNHKGGGLCLYDNDKNLIEIKYIKKNPIKFSGKITYHSTEPFEGIRYSVVAYMIKTNLHYNPYTKQIEDA